jgi:hypothetical protein
MYARRSLAFPLGETLKKKRMPELCVEMMESIVM